MRHVKPPAASTGEKIFHLNGNGAIKIIKTHHVQINTQMKNKFLFFDENSNLSYGLKIKMFVCFFLFILSSMFLVWLEKCETQKGDTNYERGKSDEIYWRINFHESLSASLCYFHLCRNTLALKIYCTFFFHLRLQSFCPPDSLSFGCIMYKHIYSGNKYLSSRRHAKPVRNVIHGQFPNDTCPSRK